MSLIGVSKTAILTLRARADEHARPDRLFEDPHAPEWLAQVEWPTELDHWYSADVAAFLAFRADEIDRLLAEQGPGKTVVELGAGLSSRFYRAGKGAERWFDLDLPEVIALREKLGVGGPEHTHLARSVLDRSWFEALGELDPSRLVLIAEGLFYYLRRADVDALFLDLRRRFPSALMICDLLGDLDFSSARYNSVVARSPVLWMIEPPFERAWTELGLEPLPEHPPAQLMKQAIERYYPRFGLFTYATTRLGSQLAHFRDRRSGTVIGRLKPC